MSDNINRPAHYTHGAIEPIDVIEDWKLGFHLGNVIKYIAREAAEAYIDREVSKFKEEAAHE